MNMLIDLLPTEVEIDGESYKINTNFRTSILFEMLMQDNTLTEEEKMNGALGLYYSEIPFNLEKAVNKLLWFYKCGKEHEELEAESGNNNRAEHIYSFEHDDDYIYSAFLDQYGIDLQDIEYLHWWKFKAMFKSLKEDNLISKIMGYRAMKIDGDMSKSEKKHYRKLKEIYALPDNRTEEEKERDFEEAIAAMM